MGNNREKSNIVIAILEEYQFNSVPTIYPHFGGTNTVFADYIIFSSRFNHRNADVAVSSISKFYKFDFAIHRFLVFILLDYRLDLLIDII